MDIVKKIKPIKATYENLSLINKLWIVLTLVSLFNFVFPHNGLGVNYAEAKTSSSLVFDIGNHYAYMQQLQKSAKQFYQQQTLLKELEKQNKLAARLKAYLVSQRSPLADYASVLVKQNNWKKIIALSNAESTLCRKYPTATANCWGVGGSDLWDMGSNLGEGVVSMNNFLNNHPLKSSVKYSQMSFERMNGLYKQPPADHWVYNNQAVYDDLSALEKNL